MLLTRHPLITYHFKPNQKNMENFELHFRNSKKVVTITLTEEDSIFDLAILFKRLLDDAGIPNNIREEEISTPSKMMQVKEDDGTNPLEPKAEVVD
jgi:hypothetical protein